MSNLEQRYSFEDKAQTVGHDQSNHIANTQANKIDKDKITYVGEP